ncbi:hypothetical protein ACLEEJ_03380 [Lonsdalea quercina]|uniref:hypothetical protein n=1 Tax=Lonsdalea quercina TaxID=71657 RepID=UPI0039753861
MNTTTTNKNTIDNGTLSSSATLMNSKQKSHKERALSRISLQTKHATTASHEDSGWTQVQMASVAPVGAVEGSVDGGGEVLVTSFTDASAYAEAFAGSLDDSLNDPEFIHRLNDSLGAEARPYRTEPTPLHLAMLADNSVKFNPTSRYAESRDEATTTTIKFGEMVTVDKAQSAVMFNHSVRLYDIHMETSGFTQFSLQTAIEQALVDIVSNMASRSVELLDTAGLTEKVTVDKPMGKPMDVAEDIIDLLAVNMVTAYGSGMSDYTLLIPQAIEPILDRAAQRAGVEDTEALLGCSVLPYSGADRGLFLVPRRFTMLSFRTASTGDIFPVSLSRDAARSAWVIEARGVLDIVADAKATDADGVEVKLPVITQLVWE